MADRVEILFRAAAERLLPRRGTVVAAVSGGADSVALLHLLARLALRRPLLGLVVAHLDHGMRRGSAADRRFVERLAAGLGLPCISGRREVGELRRRGESPEEAARRVRRGFLLEAAAEAGASRIATGHTLDDQAETVLMRLARGAGPSALAGMDAAGPGPFVRPLLGVERADLRGWLGRRRIPFREDPSNESLRYDRNRVRRVVLPALAQALNPRAARHIAEAADRLREDARFLDSLAVKRLARLAAPPRGAAIEIEAGRLCRLPRPLATRVARLLLERSGADPRRVASRHLDALLGIAAGKEGGRIDLPDGLGATRRGTLVVIERRTGRTG